MNERHSLSPNDPIDRADRRIVFGLRIGLALFAFVLVGLIGLAAVQAGWIAWATLGIIALVLVVLAALVTGAIFLLS